MTQDQMHQCDVYEVPCLENDYEKFDSRCREELALDVTAEQIINNSDFCTFIALDIIAASGPDDSLSLNEQLSGLHGKFGLYHLWIDAGHCQDHDKYAVLCVYVGKGHVKNRILSHVKRRWPEQQLLRISFFDCENRVAKYLEQLFLDTYSFHLNSEENAGQGTLFGRWDETRYEMGTEV
jgi:hypothetical protein